MLTQFGHRAFSVCGVAIRNSLSQALHLTDNYPQFCGHLKTHLFNLALARLVLGWVTVCGRVNHIGM